MKKKEGSFLQSDDWALFQKQLGRPNFQIERSDFRALLIEYPLKFFGSYLYAPRVYLKDLDDLEFLVKQAKEIARGRKSIFLRLEPQETISLSQYGFKKISSLQPDMTLVSDLSQTHESILKNMDHDTRYAVRTAEKRGVKTVSSRKIGKDAAFAIFWEMFLETNKRQSLGHYGEKYYKELLAFDSRSGSRMESEILLAELEGVYIAGAIILYYEDTATYLYAASVSGYGRFNAPSYVIWRAMSDAKDRGMKYFDFWGISDENKKWAKFSAFKRSFGGEEVHYPGTFDLPLNRSLYYLYQTAKKIIR